MAAGLDREWPLLKARLLKDARDRFERIMDKHREQVRV